MKQRLEAGDKVKVLFKQGIYKAEVVSSPAATGDMWKIRLEDGTLQYINPCCADLIGFEEIKEG